jgi:peptidyl-prolyl cis-trans isomerase D
VSAADSAVARQHALALRAEIVGGAKFEDVAKRESADTASGTNAGYLGRGPLTGRFVPEFERAAAQLRPGEVSQPVLTQFGYHLIKVDERKGDTLALRHILVRIQQNDSAATATDRLADSLAKMAANAEQPSRFDSAAKALGLEPVRLVAFEGQPLTWRGRYVPSASAWAFGGAKVGETSDLLDDESGYYLARLDSLVQGGTPEFADVRDEVRRRLVRQKKLDMLVPRAQDLARAAAASSLESAAQARGYTVSRTPAFNRLAYVPGIGRLNQAIGAAFSLPVGSVGAPIRTDDAVVVMRVDRRVNADRAAWEAQKEQQRTAMLEQTREQRVQQFMANLRREAKVVDDRRKLRERQQTSTS